MSTELSECSDHSLNQLFFEHSQAAQDAILVLLKEGYNKANIVQASEVGAEYYRRHFLQQRHGASAGLNTSAGTQNQQPPTLVTAPTPSDDTCFLCGGHVHKGSLKRHVKEHYIRYFCPHQECWKPGTLYGYGNARPERLEEQHESKHPGCPHHPSFLNMMRTTSALVDLGKHDRCESDMVVDVRSEKLPLWKITRYGRDWEEFVSFCNIVTPDQIIQVSAASNAGFQEPMASIKTQSRRDVGNVGAVSAHGLDHQNLRSGYPMTNATDFSHRAATSAGAPMMPIGTESLISETYSVLSMTAGRDSGLGRSLSQGTGVHGNSVRKTALPAAEQPAGDAVEAPKTAHLNSNELFATGGHIGPAITLRQPQVEAILPIFNPLQPSTAGPAHPPSAQDLSEIPGPHSLAEIVNTHVNRDPSFAESVQVHSSRNDPLPDPLLDFNQIPEDEEMIIDGQRDLTHDEFERLLSNWSPPPIDSTQYYNSRFPTNDSSTIHSPAGYPTNDRGPLPTCPEPQPQTSYAAHPNPIFERPENMFGSPDNSPAPTPSSSWVRNNSDISSTLTGGSRVSKRKRLSQHMAPLRQNSIDAWHTFVRFFA